MTENHRAPLPTATDPDPTSESRRRARGRSAGHPLRDILDEHVISLAEALAELGLDLKPPEALSDQALSDHLWTVIRALAGLEIFLNCTDHLSDRELYRWLWEQLLPEPLAPGPERPGLVAFRIADPLVASGLEGLMDYLRYYADEAQRRRWAAEGWHVPPRCRPPHDRDDRLPRPGSSRSRGR